MLAHWLTITILFLTPKLLSGAEAVFAPDGARVLFVLGQEGSVGYLDIGDREGTAQSARTIDVAHAGGPKTIQGLAFSKNGNLLLASPDAVWALDLNKMKAVSVAKLPEGFHVADLAYQDTTGGILVWGSFLRADHTVERFAAFWIAKSDAKAVPVLVEGIDSFEHAAFGAAGTVCYSSGADLWAGEISKTEMRSEDAKWQLRGRRIAALGTRVSGESSDASQLITGLLEGGGKLVVTVSDTEGTTLLRLPTPSAPKPLKLTEQWAMQQKATGSIQFLTTVNALPRIPTVAVRGDGGRIVYQTAAEGIRRWWLLEKTAKPKMISEESD